MCGIFGVITGNTGLVKYRELIYQGMVTGWLRGEESTGYFTVGKDKPKLVNTYKSTARGTEFMDLRESRKMMNNLYDYNVFVGHHRFATGPKNICVENAHPFTHGKVTLVHNGVFRNSFHFPHSNSQNVEPVDSAKFTYNLSMMAAGKDTTEFIQRVEGTYAAVWWDTEQEKLFITRNEDRPLSISMDEEKETLFFASERLHLEWLLTRNGIKHTEPVQAAKNWLYAMSIKKGLEVEQTEYTPGNPFSHNKSDTNFGSNWPHQNKGGRPRLPELPSPRNADISPTLVSDFQTYPVYAQKEYVDLHPEAARMANKFLDTLGVHIGSIVPMQPVSWARYAAITGGTWGRGTFKSFGRVKFNLEMDNISEDQWDKIETLGNFAHIRIVNVSTDTHSGEKTLIGILMWAETRRHWLLLAEAEAKTRRNADSPERRTELHEVSERIREAAKDAARETVPFPTGEEGVELPELNGTRTQKLTSTGNDSEETSSADSESLTFVLGPQHSMITMQSWENKTKYGCGNCGGLLGDPTKTNWIGESPLCDDCKGSSEFWAKHMGMNEINVGEA
jgi:hypothetical protein